MWCDPVLDDRSLVAGDPVVRVHANLIASCRAARQARTIVRSALGDKAVSLPADVVWVAQLLTSELVTNALLHSRTDLHVGLVCDDHTLLIAVADGHPDPPPLRVVPAIDFEESYRGMSVVATIADDFGWRPRGDVPGKIMWALVTLDHTPFL